MLMLPAPRQTIVLTPEEVVSEKAPVTDVNTNGVTVPDCEKSTDE
jgi:hypothetical protein